MASNSFGKIFRYTTFGESHGPEIGCVIDGVPPGIKITEEDIQNDLNRRRPGSSKFVTQRKEKDIVRISSGTFEGKTTGTPISLLIKNEDHKSKDYKILKTSIDLHMLTSHIKKNMGSETIEAEADLQQEKQL